MADELKHGMFDTALPNPEKPEKLSKLTVSPKPAKVADPTNKPIKVDMSNVKKPKQPVNKKDNYGEIFSQVFGEQLGARMANRLKIRPFISGAKKVGESIRTGQAVSAAKQQRQTDIANYDKYKRALQQHEADKELVPRINQAHAAANKIALAKYNQAKARQKALRMKSKGLAPQPTDLFARGFKKGVKD